VGAAVASWPKQNTPCRVRYRYEPWGELRSAETVHEG